MLLKMCFHSRQSRDFSFYFYLCRMKLSIVIPVYRVERTLNRCVESVISQSFRDIQVILVDDGSPDRCPQMCDEWAERDPRIQVIHKQNGGLSDARNEGIYQATGEYITFVDSDDDLTDDTLAHLMYLLDRHPEYDILEYPIYEHKGHLTKRHFLGFSLSEYKDMRTYWYKTKAYCHTYACNKIFRRQLFDKVKFPYGRKFEDVFTLPLLLEHCHVVATTPYGLYNYRYNDEGITVCADGKALSDLLDAHLSILSHGGQLLPIDNEYYAHILNIALDVYEATGSVPSLPMPRQPLVDTTTAGKNFKIQLLGTIGLKNLCRLNKALHSLMIWRK